MGIRSTLVACIALLIAGPVFAGPVENAERLLPVFEQVLDQHWIQAPMTHIMCGQVEQESGWRPKAELKTYREYGFGLGQITITSRFNNFEAARKLKPLKNWAWEERFDPECQLIYLTITDRSNYSQLRPHFDSIEDTWAASLVAYNAGMGTVLQRRAIAPATLRRRWFLGLDSVFLKHEDRLLYGKPLGQARNEYPIKVFKRAAKYRSKMKFRGR